MYSFKDSNKRVVTCALAAVVLIGGSIVSGCASRELTGGLVGGAVVGGAYEYQNKKAMRSLERDLRAGRISEREYHRRRNEISDRSLVY